MNDCKKYVYLDSKDFSKVDKVPRLCGSILFLWVLGGATYIYAEVGSHGFPAIEKCAFHELHMRMFSLKQWKHVRSGNLT